MTDLDAPLGQDGSRRPPRKTASGKARPTDQRRRGVTIFASCVLACVAALNAYALVVRDVASTQAPISLARAEPVPEKLTAAASAGAGKPDRSGDDVQVVYGTPDNAKPAEAPVPQPQATRISEGGPKIITVRDPSAASVGQPLQLAHLPDDKALESSEFGDLPVLTDDGRRPMDIYARPWSRTGGKRIAIVIGGLGLSQTGTNRALEKLPPEITLAFAPQGNSLNRWMEKARRQGHELLMQVPMEPFDYPRNDPGPQTLIVAASEKENLDNLHWALGRMTNYTGIVNYQGARLMTDAQAMGPILEDLSRRGLVYLNDGTGGGAQMQELAHQKGVAYISGQSVIDTSQDPKAIRAKLNQLEDIASAGGYAIGTGSALEATVDVVSDWANDAKKRGFEIVGVSALAR